MLQRSENRIINAQRILVDILVPHLILGRPLRQKNCSWSVIVRELQMSPSVVTIDSKVIQLSMVMQFNTWTFWEIKGLCTSVSRSIDE